MDRSGRFLIRILHLKVNRKIAWRAHGQIWQVLNKSANEKSIGNLLGEPMVRPGKFLIRTPN